jgi:hypothetical protein
MPLYRAQPTLSLQQRPFPASCQGVLATAELHPLYLLEWRPNRRVNVLESGIFDLTRPRLNLPAQRPSSTGTAPKRMGSWKCCFCSGICASSAAGGSMKEISGL